MLTKKNRLNGLFNHKLNGSWQDMANTFYELLDDFPLSVNRQSFKVDVAETEIGFTLTAELPGFTKDEIDIHVEDGVLKISGKRAEVSENSNENYRIRERRSGEFIRSFALSNIDEKSIDAELKNGILTINMKKVAEEKTKINVQIK